MTSLVFVFAYVWIVVHLAMFLAGPDSNLKGFVSYVLWSWVVIAVCLAGREVVCP